MSCPTELELTRDDVTAHLASCGACRSRKQRIERAVELARKVGAPPPSASRVEELRTALLAAAFDKPAPERRSRTWVWGGGLAAAALGLVVVARSAPAPAVALHHHGAIREHASTSVARATSSPDEIVVLHHGEIDVDVAPLHAGERFRVLVGDAEIEVYGTAFTITAEQGTLVEVVVQHGVVEVRGSQGRRVLNAGESWGATIRTASAPATSAEPSRDSVAPVDATSPSTPSAELNARRLATRAPPPKEVARPLPAPPVQRVAEEVAYDEAWAAMRDNRFTHAARGFARVQLLAPTGPLAEDAGFWYAVALARSDQQALAGAAFRAFLETYPRSRRVGEASAMFGWILVDTGNHREAAVRFRAAADDRDPKVRDSAAAGLAAVAKLGAR